MANTRQLVARNLLDNALSKKARHFLGGPGFNIFVLTKWDDGYLSRQWCC